MSQSLQIGDNVRKTRFRARLKPPQPPFSRGTTRLICQRHIPRHCFQRCVFFYVFSCRNSLLTTHLGLAALRWTQHCQPISFHLLELPMLFPLSRLFWRIRHNLPLQPYARCLHVSCLTGFRTATALFHQIRVSKAFTDHARNNLGKRFDAVVVSNIEPVDEFFDV